MSYNQEAERALANLPAAGSWSERHVKEHLRLLSTDALRYVFCEHMKFGQMFGAGRNLADWSLELIQERKERD